MFALETFCTFGLGGMRDENENLDDINARSTISKKKNKKGLL